MALNGVVIRFFADTKNAVSNIGRLEDALGRSSRRARHYGSMYDKAVKPALVGIAAGAALAAKVTYDSVKAAVDDQQSQARLAQAMKATTGASDDQVASMEDYISSLQKRTGLDDGKLRAGMGRILRSTKDVTRAQQLANTAAEIAVANNLDYTTVAKALARAEDGQTASLKRLGIPVGENAQNFSDLAKANKDYAKAQDEANTALKEYGPKSKEYAKALANVHKKADQIRTIKGGGVKWLRELNTQFDGSVAANMGTWAGQARNVATAWDELQESFGSGLLGSDGPPGQIDDLATALYNAGPAAEEFGGLFRDMVTTFLETLPAFLLGAKEVATAMDAAKWDVASGVNAIGDFVGFIPDDQAQAWRDKHAAHDAAGRQSVFDTWQLLYPGKAGRIPIDGLNPRVIPPPAPIDLYNPTRDKRRTDNSDATAKTRGSKTRVNRTKQ